MKDVFLVHIILPEVFTQKFYELIPLQRQYINELLEEQVVLSYSLDMERRNLWIFVSVESKKEVMRLLNTFPIIHNVTFTVHELAFHDAAHKALPDLILN